MINIKTVKQIAGAFRRFGVSGVRPYFTSFRHKRASKREYRSWIKQNELDDNGRNAILAKISEFHHSPLISIILPVYDVDEIWLRKCLDSVIAQIYPHWELCIADDASKRRHIRPLIEKYVAKDKRLRAVFRPENGHISAASNSALEIATGEFAVLLDHDDELAEDALFWVANEINEYPETSMIYSDEDLIDERGERSEPKFKPDFSRDLLYSLNLVTHLSAYRTELLRKTGGFRIGMEGSQDYDLALRVVEQIPDTAIRHIPRILYHWRTIPTSVAGNTGAKPYAFEKAREAIESHFERTGVAAVVEPSVDDLNSVAYKLPDQMPTVSLIVDGEITDELKNKINYRELDLISSGAGETAASRLNAAAASATGEILCFLDGRLIPMSRDWLREMVAFALQPEVGAVGAKLLQPNGGIDQTGFILGGMDPIRKAHNGFPREYYGNFLRAALTGNYSAVSWRCFAIRRAVFENVGGFDAEHFQENLFDVDLCLSLGELGLRVVYTPRAELIAGSHEPEISAEKAGIDYFRERWKAVLERDPFYNPNFTDDGETFRYRV